MSGVGLAAPLALALWGWLPADDEVVGVASGRANAKPNLRRRGTAHRDHRRRRL